MRILRHHYRKTIEKLRKHSTTQLSHAEILKYWNHPPPLNAPETYLKGVGCSRFLVDLIKQYVCRADSILELGCGVGRNLVVLEGEGFNNLFGVEINADAIKLCQSTHITFFNDSLESWLLVPRFQYDLVFSVATLEHIHPQQAQGVFRGIRKVTRKYLITVEDEVSIAPTHFPRNYKSIFVEYGFKQISSVIPVDVEGLGLNFQARVFL